MAKNRPNLSPVPSATTIVAKSALNYCASDRIKTIAKPKRPVKKMIDRMEDEDDDYDEICPDFDRPPVPKRYRNVKSSGTIKLAIPKNGRKKYVKGATPFQIMTDVSKNALKYVASDRIKKLARHKMDRSDPPINPFVVKSNAKKKLPSNKKEIFRKLSKPYDWKITQKKNRN